jgi:hypothetical protein
MQFSVVVTKEDDGSVTTKADDGAMTWMSEAERDKDYRDALEAGKHDFPTE